MRVVWLKMRMIEADMVEGDVLVFERKMVVNEGDVVVVKGN